MNGNTDSYRGDESARGQHRQKYSSLGQLLSDGPASVDVVLPQLISVLAAVDKAHEAKKQHRYLSPDKIRFTELGEAQVPTVTSQPIGATVVYGSPKYAAPESFESTPEASDCSLRDCYVLGFIFYEIFLGRKLFEAEFREVYTTGDISWLLWHTDKTCTAKPLTRLIKGFPPPISGLLERMMAKDPAVRTSDVTGVLERLTVAREVTRVDYQAARQGAAESADRTGGERRRGKGQSFLFVGSWLRARLLATWNRLPADAREIFRESTLSANRKICRSISRLTESLMILVSKSMQRMFR